LSAWLKEQANNLPPLEETLQPVECKKIPVLDVDELWPFVFRRKTGKAAHIERWNNTLRKQLARFLRKTLSFSKCVKMHETGSPGSIIHSDGWRGYNGLVDMGYKKHFRVHHGEHEFARGNCHINGIESFWSYAKRRLAKFVID